MDEIGGEEEKRGRKILFFNTGSGQDASGLDSEQPRLRSSLSYFVTGSRTVLRSAHKKQRHSGRCRSSSVCWEACPTEKSDKAGVGLVAVSYQAVSQEPPLRRTECNKQRISIRHNNLAELTVLTREALATTVRPASQFRYSFLQRGSLAVCKHVTKFARLCNQVV